MVFYLEIRNKSCYFTPHRTPRGSYCQYIEQFLEVIDMEKRGIDIRLTSRILFVYYHKKLGIGDKSIKCGACTNKRLLSKYTGIGEGLLINIFTRKGFSYYEDDNVVIMKVSTASIEKGRQSMARKGKGGMERFIEKYTIKKREEY
jgi:hypothetical protein